MNCPCTPSEITLYSASSLPSPLPVIASSCNAASSDCDHTSEHTSVSTQHSHIAFPPPAVIVQSIDLSVFSYPSPLSCLHLSCRWRSIGCRVAMPSSGWVGVKSQPPAVVGSAQWSPRMHRCNGSATAPDDTPLHSDRTRE